MAKGGICDVQDYLALNPGDVADFRGAFDVKMPLTMGIAKETGRRASEIRLTIGKETAVHQQLKNVSVVKTAIVERAIEEVSPGKIEAPKIEIPNDLPLKG